VSQSCTRCEGTGFLNIEQVPEELQNADVGKILAWLECEGKHTDVQVCDCCGDGAGWYGEPGQHYSSADPPGKNGPYANNGGLCKCH
jgi:hypothetical protein